VGHTLDLLVASIVLLLLFVATYSQRRTWITLGSTALTIVLVAGGAFFYTAQGPGPLHDGLSQLAKTLPAGWDRPALKLTAAVEQAAASLARARNNAAAHEPQPILTASASEWLDWDSWSVGPWLSKPWPLKPWSLKPWSWGSWSWDSWFGTEPGAALEPEEAEEEPAPATSTASGAPIKWFLDAPSPLAGEAFVVSGANASDQPLKVVRAVLKPDSGEGKVKLTVDVEGHDGAGSTVVPAGARFHLKAESLTAPEVEELGGAILSVAYEQAGRRKSSIMYLTAPMLAAQ
jgi:hypothetical protein